ncbi:MAG: hypothetical protein N3A60_10120, partial [Thermanaerothrix sp.]|nr:hypothetical protein [Thermanaerothrix sp.]
MAKHGKKYLQALAKIDPSRVYEPKQALELIKEISYANFDATVEVHMRTGLDPRQADQQVRDVVVLPHGLVLIDAPFRPEDIRSWRSTLVNLGGGVDRLLVNLDAHMDRTLGSRAMECTVIAHEGVVSVLRNRPSTLKAQGVETGAEWELYENLGSVRWSPPEITFTEHMKIFWNEAPIILEYHPGPSSGAIWVNVLEHKLVFVGDAIVYPQPPFLAQANIPEWLRTLEILASPEYRDYLIISGRTG